MPKNQHRRLTGEQLHNPKGFDEANSSTMLSKNSQGSIEWIDQPVLKTALDYVSPQTAPPTENTGDVYLLDDTGDVYTISTVTASTNNTNIYAFSGSPDLSSVSEGDYLVVSSCVNEINNGIFAISAIDNSAKTITVFNIDASASTDETTGGNAYYTLSAWDGLAKGYHAQFGGTVWNSTTPKNAVICFDEALGLHRYYSETYTHWDKTLAAPTALNYKGGYNASTNTPDLDVTPNSVQVGDLYTVTVAGTFYTEDLEAGDLLIAEVDNPSQLSDWTRVQKNIAEGVLFNVVEDTSPQLGGNLDVNGFSLTSGGSTAISADTSANVTMPNGNLTISNTASSLLELHKTGEKIIYFKDAAGSTTDASMGTKTVTTSADTFFINTGSTTALEIDSSQNIDMLRGSLTVHDEIFAENGLQVHHRDNIPSGVPALSDTSSVFSLLKSNSSNTPLYGLLAGISGSSGNVWLQSQRVDSTTAYDLLLNPKGGGVSIGNDNPSTELHVSGSGEMFRLETSSATGNNLMTFYTGTTQMGYFGYASSSNNNMVMLNDAASGNIQFWTTDASNTTAKAMDIDLNGNIAIGGTPSGSAQLYMLPNGATKYGVWSNMDVNTTSATADFLGSGSNLSTGNHSTFHSSNGGIATLSGANIAASFYSEGISAGNQFVSAGLYLEENTAGTKKYGIVQEGNNDNLFNGRIEVGGSVPTGGDKFSIRTDGSQLDFIEAQHSTNAGTTENGYIKVQIGNNTKYIKVYDA